MSYKSHVHPIEAIKLNTHGNAYYEITMHGLQVCLHQGQIPSILLSTHDLEFSPTKPVSMWWRKSSRSWLSRGTVCSLIIECELSTDHGNLECWGLGCQTLVFSVVLSASWFSIAFNAFMNTVPQKKHYLRG